MLSAKAVEAIDCRVYLCGRVTVERLGRVMTDGALAGPQGRLLFAFLGTRRNHPISKAQVIDAVWGAKTPPSAETAINALISKLRTTLRGLGIPSPHGVATEVGTYQFLIPGAWIDIEHARTAVDRAEGALRRNAIGEAWADANVAAAITRQPFLPDEQRTWVEQQRTNLARLHRRALLTLSEASARNGEHELGIQHATEALAAEPFDEQACQALMRAHAAAGNRAEALRVYAACRKLFRDELGAEPSEKTAQVFLGILRSSRSS
jgi:DNA-binding SARP family transcriptional activator